MIAKHKTVCCIFYYESKIYIELDKMMIMMMMMMILIEAMHGKVPYEPSISLPPMSRNNFPRISCPMPKHSP